MLCARVDIAYVASVVSRFMSNHKRAHWQALKRLLHYLKGSLGRILVYCGARQFMGEVPIEEFVDSDFVWCLNTRKSLTDYVFNAHGTVISWKASLQNVVAGFVNH